MLKKALKDPWQAVIGLEVHAQIISQSKLMSGASASGIGDANENVSMVDAAMPGMLPVVNAQCIYHTVRMGLAIDASINAVSEFSRKNYFYPDLPQGYQISQADKPLVGEGVVHIDLPDGRRKSIDIERIHVEQDAGKSLHDKHPNCSLIDLNRCGVGLMEIVTKPQLSSSLEAAIFVEKLQAILRCIGACDGIMARGSMRVDANVSVCYKGKAYGTRTECKNINSIRFLKQAIEGETRRQIAILERGEKVLQETRSFDPVTGRTHAMRTKEDAKDYRYFPDPDLLPIVLDDVFIDKCRKSLPELPDAKRKRFIEQYSLSPYDASILVSKEESATYFERVAAGVENKKLAANWIVSVLFGVLKKCGKALDQSPITAEDLAQLLNFLEKKVLSSKMAKDVFQLMFETGKSAQEIVQQQNLQQVTDEEEIEAMITTIVADSPQNALKAKDNPRIIGWFVGQVMRRSQGRANPAIVDKIVRKKLFL